MKPLPDLTDEELAEIGRRAARLPDAPAHAIARAIQLGVRLPSPTEPLRELAQALRAVLRIDSWASPALAPGMRGGDELVRHLLYSAGGSDIDLRVVPAGRQFVVHGQILGPDESGSVELIAGPSATDTPPRTSALDGLGEFRFDDVPAGSYSVVVRLGANAIVLPDLVLGERPR